jgi:HD-like signal output (HDOD) protein
MTSLVAWLIDDDELILRALQRMLKRRCPAWEIQLFQQPSLMLQALQQHPKPNLVICDRVMPDYSGEQVLTQVRYLAPAAIRALLTADTSTDIVIEDCADIHHFLAKPFTEADVALVFSCAEQLAKLPLNSQVRQELGHLNQLPILPAIFRQLQLLLQQQHTTSQQLAKLLAQDAVLTGKILQLANSPFMGFSRKTASLEESVLRLGFGLIESIALCLYCEQELHCQLDNLLHQQISQHSYQWAACARQLAQGSHLPVRIQDLVFMAALFSGLGQLVLAAQGRDSSQLATEQQWQQPQPDAVLVSVYLLTLWGFDPVLSAILLQLPLCATGVDEVSLSSQILHYSQCYLTGQDLQIELPAALNQGWQQLLTKALR